MYTPNIYLYNFVYIATVKGEKFAGLNFHGFRGFQEYHESFPVNVNASLK